MNIFKKFLKPLHSWEYFKKGYEPISWKHFFGYKKYFFCRKCKKTGIEQVKCLGIMGDGKWKNINEPWTHDWEQEQYSKSIIIKYAKNEKGLYTYD